MEKASHDEMDSPPAGQPPPLAHKTSALARWSLVLGILSMILCFCGLIIGIPGVICGHEAQKRIKSSGGALRGRGLATGGLVTGYLGILLGLILIITIHDFMRSRAISPKDACINNLRLIDAAKEEWAQANKKQAPDTPTMQNLRAYLGRGPALELPTCPGGGVYTVGAVGQKPTCSIPGHVLP